MNINAVFQGGGVKGIALAGAVSAIERLGYGIHQVAGTSSGAIVASLVAAGYRADEMRTIIEGTPFTEFLQRAPIFNTKVIGPLSRLFLKKGLYSGEALEHWIYQLLLAKGIRTFGDLKSNQLRIVASDISGRKLLVLPDDIAQYGVDPKRFLIAKAVRMSTSIPYFFDPVVIRKKTNLPRKRGEKFADQFVYIVDGGLLSNFPLWLFDNDDPTKVDSHTPTIGFQLVGRGTGKPNTIFGPVSMLRALFSTMLDAHDDYYIQEHNRFRSVKIPTHGIGVTDFDLTPEQSVELFESGMKSTMAFFGKWKFTDYKHHYLTHVCRVTPKPEEPPQKKSLT
ncbi:patatin-like phospholipase family protein [Paenibacillus validus]|uniref:patatin-like phospholipase family protein n=1 Tax=Paenibacillus validus TaxID=44253 RepID=UPI000FD788F1|nr:patatin-like phospholipase family protein [Paenibacillus validus]MED4601999.1 patatin-like phospholipase family protein [Paenibacillus validus]MED4608004.1 patatin-like phospholipase family protein [Paenibacillus validus]